ncbi:MAG TPA: hypothetical protein VJ579_01050 [Candidatus Paceibacterota bacterium]|nr:hypothetical protein [Candidatus Paceibacterota bacterium]
MENLETIATVVSFAVLGLGIILGEEKLRDKVAELKSVAIRWVIYSVLDWGLVILSIALVGVMRRLEVDLYGTMLAMWLFDTITAYALYEICLRSGEDLTLGRQYRKSYELVKKKSRLLGFGTILFLVIKSIIWDGPERLLEFWHKEFAGKKQRAIGTLVFLAAFQAIFWVILFWMGYDYITK